MFVRNIGLSEGVNNGFSALNERVVQPVLNLCSYVTNPLISAGATLADYTVVPLWKVADPVLTVGAGVGGAVAVVAGMNELQKDEPDTNVAAARIAVGVGGIAYATARVAYSYLPKADIIINVPVEPNVIYSNPGWTVFGGMALAGSIYVIKRYFH